MTIQRQQVGVPEIIRVDDDPARRRSNVLRVASALGMGILPDNVQTPWLGRRFGVTDFPEGWLLDERWQMGPVRVAEFTPPRPDERTCYSEDGHLVYVNARGKLAGLARHTVLDPSAPLMADRHNFGPLAHFVLDLDTIAHYDRILEQNQNAEAARFFGSEHLATILNQAVAEFGAAEHFTTGA